jgi:hypothetical protein
MHDEWVRNILLKQPHVLPTKISLSETIHDDCAAKNEQVGQSADEGRKEEEE